MQLRQAGEEDVRFIDPGAGTNAVTSNNIVAASVVVQSLACSQTHGCHHTRIQPGMTLTVSNSAATNVFLAGTATQVAATLTTTNPPFSNWTATSTGAFSGGVFHFNDVEATNYQQRFYRAVTP